MTRYASQPYARLMTEPNGDLRFESSYDAALVAALKAQIPFQERRWDKARKAWIVAANHGPTCADLAQTFLSVSCAVPALAAQTTVQTPQTCVITLEYLGMCKERADGTTSAYGFADGDWSVVIPDNILRAYFYDTDQNAPTERQTLYALLGVRSDVPADALKTAYKRMARQWHPDVCREPNANEMFLAIKRAYDLLSNPVMRKKYDAGLYFEGLNRDQRQLRRRVFDQNYRSPLRCGMLCVEATQALGRWHVTVIHSWDDIQNNQGRTLVTSWDIDRQMIMREWV